MDEPSSLIGALVAGKYRVDSQIGRGSTGDVYLCTHTGLDKVVALKILHADMVKHENFVERFKREARAASKLEHPNSVRVLDFGEDPSGILYIAMEYIDGRDLWTLLDEEWPLENGRVVDIMAQVLAALGKAHSLGIVHRDLKPENIMVRTAEGEEGTRDHVTVCDFGIAQLSPIQLSGSYSPTTTTVTGDGMVVGTPAYMSPEQARAEPLDARSDVYSAGVVLFQMLTRQLPFTAETPLAVAVMHCSTPPPAPSQFALVHPALESVCLRALAKTKEARFQSAREMQQALLATLAATAIQLDRAPHRRRPYLPLAAPPVALPPPAASAKAKSDAPPSLAPFELHSDPGPAPRNLRDRIKRAAVIGVVSAGVLASGITVYSSLDAPAPMPTPEQVSTEASSEAMDDLALTASSTPAPAELTPAPALELAVLAENTPGPVPRPSAAPDRDRTAIALEAPKPPARGEPSRPEPPAPAKAAKPEPRDEGPLLAAAAQPEPAGHEPEPRARETEDVVTVLPTPAVVPPEPARTKADDASPEVAAAAKQASPSRMSTVLPAAEIKITEVVSEAEIDLPVGLVELPSRGPVTALVGEEASKPAALSGGTSPEHAQVRFSSIVSSAAVSRASIRNALNEPALRRCYADALRLGAAGPSPLTARLELATNMAGRIESASVTSPGLPKALTNCVEQVARSGRVREVDTGTARATVMLEFEP